uniref:ATP-dependent DNA helicase n=1 Tax=Tanacetum cinerariifolium TaxID=118510 RepID=A0A6L2JCT4_TANCI|nr:DNA helicase [Tanacetum cinerariifolium]
MEACTSRGGHRSCVISHSGCPPSHAAIIRNERSSDSGVCGSSSPFVSSVSGPCKPLLSGGYRSPQSNCSVGSEVVVLDFGNSEVRLESCESFFGVNHSEGSPHCAYEFPNDSPFSGSYIHSGPTVLDFENRLTRLVGAGNELRRMDAHKSTPSNMLFVTKTKQKRTRSSSVGSGHHEAADGVNHGGVTGSYIDIGNCEWVCEYCRATFWRRDPYVFKISGQIYHWIGSLCPEPGNPPRFLQLYIYDTHNEVSNRMRRFSEGDPSQLDPEFVATLIRLLDEHNELVRLFRLARDRVESGHVSEFHIRLVSVVVAREYDLPTSGTLGAIVFENGLNTRTDYDVVIESRGGFPQPVNKFHPSYMSLQFPLLFVYGEPGFYPQMKQRQGVDKRLSMNQYYVFQLHERLDCYALLFRGGHLFQQYVVGVFCSIEQNRLDLYRLRQNDIRREYLSGVHDAISRGDRESSQVGGRLILPRTFTEGSRYMYSHYLDALAICRVLVLYMIEFQKRGLPHCHTLVWVDSKDKIRNASEVDRYISAKLPDPATDPEGYIVVSEMMVHGQCGLLHSDAVCMKEGKCGKNFPKKFIAHTFFNADGYVHYRRRETHTCAFRRGVDLDNGYIVPYNRTDKIAAKIVRQVGDPPVDANNGSIQIDEIQNYIDGRFICPHESCWRILKYDIHGRQPTVQILYVHLEGMQPVTFRDHQPLTLFVNNEDKTKTTLTEWLEYNKRNGDGLHLTYIDFTKEFMWYSDTKSWRWRQRRNSGCKTFDDIRTVNKRLYPTFRAACEALGFLGDDKEWHTALEEVAFSESSQQLRSLFVQILIFCDVADPMRLWKSFWKRMSDDVPRTISNSLHIQDLYMNDPELEGSVLYEVEAILKNYSKTVADFGLPPLSPKSIDALKNRELMEEKSYNRAELAKEVAILVPKLNSDQKTIYDMVLRAAYENKQEMIFVYGHGGTGKTFLWRTLINSMRSEGKIVLAVVSSGIASLLLPAAHTAYSRCFEALDRTLRDVLDVPEKLFGGKTIVLGENVPLLQPGLNKYEKTRAANFASWLLELGDGKTGIVEENSDDDSSWITVLEEFCITDETSGLKNLIGFIYDENTLQHPTTADLQQKAIVCLKNTTADEINETVLGMLHGKSMVYTSSDEAIPVESDRGEVELLYPPDYLNTLQFSGFPSHRLELKVGAPIMLLRNMNLQGGMCKGTLMIIKKLSSRLIKVNVKIESENAFIYQELC